MAERPGQSRHISIRVLLLPAWAFGLNALPRSLHTGTAAANGVRAKTSSRPAGNGDGICRANWNAPSGAMHDPIVHSRWIAAGEEERRGVMSVDDPAGTPRRRVRRTGGNGRSRRTRCSGGRRRRGSGCRPAPGSGGRSNCSRPGPRAPTAARRGGCGSLPGGGWWRSAPRPRRCRPGRRCADGARGCRAPMPRLPTRRRRRGAATRGAH